MDRRKTDIIFLYYQVKLCAHVYTHRDWYRYIKLCNYEVSRKLLVSLTFPAHTLWALLANTTVTLQSSHFCLLGGLSAIVPLHWQPSSKWKILLWHIKSSASLWANAFTIEKEIFLFSGGIYLEEWKYIWLFTQLPSPLYKTSTCSRASLTQICFTFDAITSILPYMLTLNIWSPWTGIYSAFFLMAGEDLRQQWIY